MNDYRSTQYCEVLSDIEKKKSQLMTTITKNHPRAKDMHNYISKNASPYKNEFMLIYNNKCAYCGVSTFLVRKYSFQIDHIIFEKSFSSKIEAGYIGNLALACDFCNNKKNDFLIEPDFLEDLHPDRVLIKALFVRNPNDFYINLSKCAENNNKIKNFYNQLELNREHRRLDYLIMSIKGMIKKHQNNKNLTSTLAPICLSLIKKRNEL